MKKKKTKYYIKNNLIGLIIGGIIFGSLGVYAAITFPSNEVSFDPSNSTLKSTNVKAAIDELYKKCTTPSAADQIIEDAGLEKDPYECRYFFTGANPNNYITFNDEKAGWRIISVECDGTIKIIRNDSIGDMGWNETVSNDWATSDLSTYLNSTYYNKLTATAQNQIVAKDWGIGAVTYDNNDLADQINDENGTKWKGKIALFTVSEYIRSNSNKSSCGTYSANNTSFSTCVNTNWLNDTNGWLIWTLSKDDSGLAHNIYTNASPYNQGMINLDYAYGELPIRPTLYISSDIQITGGTGTKSDPYEISL